MQLVLVKNLTQPLLSPLKAGWCQPFRCQLQGLMFRKNLAADHGLLLVQKRESRLDAAIHMLFMRIDIGVVWVNSDLEVVDLRIARRWRPFYIPKAPAKYILEIAVDRFNEFNLGDKLDFEPENLA